jgi:hypothetical protein
VRGHRDRGHGSGAVAATLSAALSPCGLRVELGGGGGVAPCKEMGGEAQPSELSMVAGGDEAAQRGSSTAAASSCSTGVEVGIRRGGKRDRKLGRVKLTGRRQWQRP